MHTLTKRTSARWTNHLVRFAMTSIAIVGWSSGSAAQKVPDLSLPSASATPTLPAPMPLVPEAPLAEPTPSLHLGSPNQLPPAVQHVHPMPRSLGHPHISRPLPMVPWQAFAQGEYLGRERQAHVPDYRLRVDDVIQFVYRLTREESAAPYELNVGDELRIESLIDTNLNRELIRILPDGTISLKMIGEVRAARRTVAELRGELEERYKKYYNVPAMNIEVIKDSTQLEDLRAAVDGRFGAGGQGIEQRVTPEGTVQLPAIGSVHVQNLTLDELKYEIDQQYSQTIGGIEVTPSLTQRAPRFVYIIGEVNQPGRFNLTGPTTVSQALALAGSWRFSGNIRQVVVFRRTNDWQLIATKFNIRPAMLGRDMSLLGDVWVRDSDLILVPKTGFRLSNEFIEQVFTRGIWSAYPANFGYTDTGSL